MEAQANVVGGPVAVCIAKNRVQEFQGVGESDGAVFWIEFVEDPVSEGVEPGLHAVGQGRGAGDEVDGLNSEAGLLEETPIDGGGRVEGCGFCFGVDAEGARVDCRAVRMAAMLPWPPSSATKRPPGRRERWMLASALG